MLEELRIQNFAIIDNLELEFAPGFNVITGETGAGKSIMLGAIGLLLGNRADSKLLFNTEQKCSGSYVSSHFTTLASLRDPVRLILLQIDC